MSIFYVQEFGTSKGMIVELIHQKDNDVILRCVKDDFVFAVSKSNFNKFYSDYDEHEKYAFNPSKEELDSMNVSDLGKL
jgi:hypothetical protein